MDYDLLSSYAGLLGLATVSIYVGAHGSLPPPRNADGTRSEEEEVSERMSSGDAYLFPVIGSAALVGLYAVVKYFGTAWINALLGWYFSIAGVGAVWKSSIALTRWAVGDVRWKAFDEVAFTIKKGTNAKAAPLLSFAARTPSLALLPLAIIPSALYTFHARSILLTDVLALAFAHNALALLKIDSFQTGSILLGGLFFYDVWWVFGTEVMVKVATSLDVPIKLLWPKSLSFGAGRGFTMLGLGDVVVPGIFIAFALRYDHYRAGAPGHSRFGKPYFYAGLAAYVAGLVTTMGVMHLFGKAQPALLYLSPACIVSFGLTGVFKGDLGAAWAWSDDEEDKAAIQKEPVDVEVSEK
ncbi:peptidase A22B, signal peptide peptidase [Mycena albidolilacea]|uniref:Peptidase A22B, signal peptide peptidase n=1 Tax=Mycena albidolilacea TaxID=1033008 RepID=A0AAD7ERC7_9AGAR|nr:peptidase A22B, signal peptide peptidase [Mycena albidolilacea]